MADPVAGYREVPTRAGVRLRYFTTASGRQLINSVFIVGTIALCSIWAAMLVYATRFDEETSGAWAIPLALALAAIAVYSAFGLVWSWSRAHVDVDPELRLLRVRTPLGWGYRPRVRTLAFSSIARFDVDERDRVQAVREDGSRFDVVDFEHKLSHEGALALAERLRVLVGEMDGRDRPRLRVADADAREQAEAGEAREEEEDERGWGRR